VCLCALLALSLCCRDSFPSRCSGNRLSPYPGFLPCAFVAQFTAEVLTASPILGLYFVRAIDRIVPDGKWRMYPGGVAKRRSPCESGRDNIRFAKAAVFRNRPRISCNRLGRRIRLAGFHSQYMQSSPSVIASVAAAVTASFIRNMRSSP
jgi:hypothetical protein